jgi:hypothetical protein
MLPLAPVAFPLTCPAVRPRGLGGAFVAPDQATALARLENELERQVRPESTRPGRSARETRIVPPDLPSLLSARASARPWRTSSPSARKRSAAPSRMT